MEKPITLTIDEVRTALAGNLKEIRRPVTPAPYVEDNSGFALWAMRGWSQLFVPTKADRHDDPILTERCPIGISGDKLWVREPGKWTTDALDIKTGEIITGKFVRWFADEKKPPRRHARGDRMPQWASRITLQVVDVAAERVEGVWFWVLTVCVVRCLRPSKRKAA